MAECHICTQDLNAWYHDEHALKDISAEIPPRGITAIIGPSGCGKSTLLAFVAGSIGAPFVAEGRVRVGDDDVTASPPERRRIGILFQDDLLFPHLTVGGNLAFALHAALEAACRLLETRRTPGVERWHIDVDPQEGA